VTFNRGIRLDSGRARGGGGRGRGVAVGGGLGGLVVVVIALFLGVSPDQLTGGAPGIGSGVVDPTDPGTGDFSHCQTGEDANQFVDCRIIATAESLDAVWAELLPASGVEYVQPQLVVFGDQVSTGCGSASSAVGPFYCPADQTAYFDTSFFSVLVDQFGSSGGPLAQEYVVAHEFGHHVQAQLGLLDGVQADPSGAESAAVRSELQADCLAGVWAGYAATTPDPDTGVPFLEQLTDADVADALSAAASVGDDRIQETAQGRTDPETYTHGTSEQRQRWFTTGYTGGSVDGCDTFSASEL